MLQGPEILVILLVALVVFGPERLPELARKLGRWTSELREAAREVRAGLQAEVEAVQEVTDEITAPVKEATEALSEAAAPVRDAKEALDSATKPHRWVGPKPQSGPTPEDAMRDLSRIEASGAGEDGTVLDVEVPEETPEDAEPGAGEAGQGRPAGDDGPVPA